MLVEIIRRPDNIMNKGRYKIVLVLKDGKREEVSAL